MVQRIISTLWLGLRVAVKTTFEYIAKIFFTWPERRPLPFDIRYNVTLAQFHIGYPGRVLNDNHRPHHADFVFQQQIEYLEEDSNEEYSDEEYSDEEHSDEEHSDEEDPQRL
ncbi:hypothetical protein BDZ45DRAFT_670216 [Acephala macrosclerotiorum]|nr:hypothetical protein BDZ45DRAFT_670216 [Acephala macrosclerotiorum]